MRFRRWVGWLAIAAIMLHTATVARHNVIVFQAIPNELAALAGFEPGAICQVGSEADKNGQAQGLPGNGQGGKSKSCPICLGFASAHALQASEMPCLRIPRAIYLTASVPQEPDRAPPAKGSLPPTRGPPSLA